MIEVVGVGAAGWSSLGPAERELVVAAEVVLGGARHLAMLPAVTGQRREPWPTDLRAALPGLVDGHQERSVVVLASGDPLVAGVGSILVDLLGAERVRIHPAVSSVALARARLGWPEETVELIRLRGDDVDLVRRALFPGRRMLILSRDAASPAEIAALLVGCGFGASALTVLGDLGGPGESRRTERAADWAGASPPLNIVALECRAETVGAWSLAPGLPDAEYDHDGQLTKRHLRASALAHLLPRPGELLWDVGAGAGSVGIEWSRSHPSCRTLAVERDPDRAKRIRSNARSLGVPGLEVVLGSAPDVLDDLPAPDAVFVGGGASAATLERSWSALPAGGRMVVHAVTQETQVIMTAAWQAHGGELTRIAVEQLERIGSYHGWKPARAIVQWSATKATG